MAACFSGGQALAYTSEDGTLQINGFVENATYTRRHVGLSKMRNTVQIEGSKDYGAKGPFSNLSFVGTFRASYDAVYDLNDDQFGSEAGGEIGMESIGGSGTSAWGASDVSTGVLGFGFDTTENPNQGLDNLGSAIHDTEGGVGMGVPVRPCDVDSRGCIDDYLDYDESDLKYPEFNDRLDFLREAYIDATMPTDSGATWNFRFGRQQVVWGRTDLFRVLDVINPVDYSRHNIYDELEDIRIPMWMATGEYRMGATETFDDLNMQFVWNLDKFRPNNLGQGGTPYAILDAGSFFRAMKNCWDNGCSVANFAGGALSTDFPEHVIGIRDVHLPDWSISNSQFGVKLEGDYQGLGFSLNALTYRSQLPSLRGVVDTADNPFTTDIESQSYDYLIAFDMHFPRVNLLGGSLDFYVDDIKSVFRVEAAYTEGEEFANTLRPELYSDSDVFRYVIGWDRPTFIPFLNERRAFLLSAQLFGEYLVDHERDTVNGIEVGIPNWEINHVGTFLIKGWFKNDRVSPQVIMAHDFKAHASVIAPSVDWLISDNLRLTVGANVKVGDGAQEFDDCRACNPFPPFTGTGSPGDLSLRNLAGYEPLGRFRSGPIGMAQAEDEFQVTLRYRF
ncbi:MAG: DUF1302 domain-containing protein [gamma proteobacterium symbiont of Ctena orbiculata]|nr:MAG: DUF1302 domain-containing protein [gamma proteobacterium symbiont of Ctena orbiculata]PVV24436.1 MAG: DUF1302 domain-containing protein [gamma proteobacterium symbiont of Ctena orbiculata]PVV26332.1 MAG: DUF1302 domain-containing protein [gamma proteobacterium symbiont of Ctena orbiculata]